MKKYLPLLLLCLLLWAGCEKKEETSLTDSVRLAAGSGAEETEAEEAAAPTAQAVRTPVPGAAMTIGRAGQGKTGTEYTLAETVLYKTEDFLFAVKNMSINRYGDHILSVTWTNRTDKTLLIRPENVVVNGYSLDPMWMGTAEANTSASGEICFAAEDMALIGSEYIDSLTFDLAVSEEEGLYAATEAAVSVSLRPTGIPQEETVRCPGVEHREGESILLETEAFDCLLLGEEETSAYDTEKYACVLLVFLENRREEAVIFSMDAVAVNGEEIDPYWAEKVPANTRAYSRVFFTREDFDKAGILSTDAVEFTLTVYLEGETENLTEAECVYRP